MELIERISLDKINYLNSLTESQLKPYLNKCKNEEDRKKEYNKIKQFCMSNLKTKGITKRIYSKPESTPTAVDNRLYSGGSVQSLIKAVRLFCMADTTSDLDMENCHPKILSYICKKNGYLTPNLDYYIANRELILEQFADRNEGKTNFLKALNTDATNKKVSNAFFKKFDKEMKEIQNTITILPCYKDIVDSVPFTKMYNINGSAINRILCSYEDKILASAIHAVNLRNIEVAVLMFDGMMLYGQHYHELLNYIKDHVERDFEGLGMNWTFKEQESDIVIPDGWVEEEKEDDKYNSMVEEFEKTHCKITNLAMFVTEDTDKILFQTKGNFAVAHEHISSGFDKNGNPVSFINKWLGLNTSIRHYRDVDTFPDEENCPKDIFNLWRPFAYEKYTEPYEKDVEGLAFMLNHYSILCNHEESVTDYFIKWNAQMIQYPAVKTNTPVFIGAEGTGKSSFFDLQKVILGDEKVMETDTPSVDVWGQFNEMLQYAFLINLDELSKKETEGAEGYIKGLITRPTININIKGTTKFKMKSFHRFAITTNNENPIETKKGDRRKWFVKCSDEKKGDTEYWKTFRKYLKQVNTMRTLYDHLKSIEGLDEFDKIPMPVTEFQQNIMESYRKPEDMWLEYLSKNETVDELKLSNDECYSRFSIWSGCNCTYTTSRVHFARNILNGGYGVTSYKSNGLVGKLIPILDLKARYA
jgi:hypothetical protein